MSPSPAVIVENLGKRYALNVDNEPAEVANGSLWRAITLPFRHALTRKKAGEHYWAVKDVSFSLDEGEAIGIIGRNGSGKSTLLKLLAGVVEPSSGRARLYGRIGSLLEVGTGFHPDLTGRENVFLNGSLLGIKRAEIVRLFDTIIDFADIDRFIDTPVKHYSSGMYVRLAFSVAVHLRTDILILDEVMAVGDAEFQKKCMDVMERVVHDGRTVLFVSHSAASVGQFCTKGLLLDRGQQTFFGSAADTITQYLQMIHHLPTDGEAGAEEHLPTYADLRDVPRWDGSAHHLITSLRVRRGDGVETAEFATGDAVVLEIGYECDEPLAGYCMINIIDPQGQRVASLHSTHDNCFPILQGSGVLRCVIPEIGLNTGDYYLMPDIGVIKENMYCQWLDSVPNALKIRLHLGDFLGGVGLQRGQGDFAVRSRWCAEAGMELCA